MYYHFEFRVLSESSHVIIFGCDLLMESEAAIHHVNGDLYLSALPMYDAVFPDLPLKCHVTLMAQTTSFSFHLSLITDVDIRSEVLLGLRQYAL